CLIIAVFGVLFAAFVARQLKPRDPPSGSTPIRKADPGAVLETQHGKLLKYNGSRQGVSVDVDQQLVYADGSSKLTGVTIVTDERNGSRTFTITSKEGHVGNKDSSIALDGAVHLAGSDGMTATTEHASCVESEAVVRAPGPVEFGRGRMKGTGVGMTWNKNADVMTILDQAIVHVAPDDKGVGAAEITAGTAAFARRDKYIRFERGVRILRNAQTIEAATAVAYLTEDEKRIDTIELHDQARISATKAAPGALQGLTGAEMNLKYAADGEALQHALGSGRAV